MLPTKPNNQESKTNAMLLIGIGSRARVLADRYHPWDFHSLLFYCCKSTFNTTRAIIQYALFHVPDPGRKGLPGPGLGD